jgi:C-terminal processing protease CtpA/Prc
VEGLYALHKEQVPADIKKRLANPKATAAQMQELLEDVFAQLQPRKDFDAHKAVAACIEAIFARLEPAAPPELRSGLVPVAPFTPFPRGAGVGLKIQVDKDSGMLRVVTPLFNGPAHKAGIRAGDLITHIRIHGAADAHGNELAPPRTISTKGMTVEEAERLLRGKSGTRVTLVVVPAK